MPYPIPIDHQPPLAASLRAPERLAAALAWVWVLSLVLLVLRPDSPYVRFHARQGAGLFGVSVVLWVLFSFVGTRAWFLPGAVQTVVFVLSVLGFVQAWRGRWWRLPLLGTFFLRERL